MIFPEQLKTGDAVALVAPAFPIAPDKTKECIEKLKSFGYRVKIGEALKRNSNIHNYLAGDGKVRGNDINRMFQDPEVKAIFCTRGGYGSSHIMKYLDLEMIKRNPKIFTGYSDITNIHVALQQICGMVSFHGPMVFANMLEHYDDYTRESFLSAINMGDELEFKNPPEEGEFKILNSGIATGTIVGGNLSLIARGIGSFFQLNTAGKILFLEDISESIPVLDMLITQMEYAGLFEQVNGLLFGDFTDCNNDRYDAGYGIEEFLKDRFREYQIPMMYHVRSGHEHPMGTIPLGTYCKMDTYENSIKFYKG